MYLNKKIFSLLLASTITSGAVCFPIYAEESDLKDSGINYTESVETIGNPGVGYSSTVWANCKPEKTPVYNPTGNLMLFFIDIGGFSCGVNGTKNEDGTYTEGVDYDFDDAFFKAWDETLQNCRNNGCMVALRFRYDDEGKDNPEPASFEQVLRHIEQLKNSGLFEKYSDIIAFVECGFVGKWGEMHGGKYTSVQHKAQVLEALLQAVPAPIPVTVRTPDIFAEWAGITRAELADRELIDSLTESKYTSDIQKNKDRIGLFDDGYMGSNSDLGTYANREIETDWLSHQTLTSYFGGEFSGNIEFAKKYDTYLPENAIPEMYKTHLSYINGNIFNLYKDYTFSEAYDINGADNSAYYGQTVFKFMRDHIGYRFVLRDSKLTGAVEQGGDIQVDFKIENTGFANVIPSAQSYVLLEKDGVFTYAEADTDCRQWLSCTETENHLNIKLPDCLPEGDWNVYLKLSMGTPLEIANMSSRSIRFANEGVWNPSLGANRLGTVKVTESSIKGTNNTLKASENTDNTPSQFYSAEGKTVVDGVQSSPREWTDDMIVGEYESGVKLYAKADDKYLYVMSNIENNAAAPVYNLQLKNPVNSENYWLYYASNGFIYFNHGDYNGCQCKWSDNMTEFRIPFEVMDLEPGMKLDNLRIFMQDSGNDWKLMSDVRTAECTIPSDFVVLSALTEVRLNEGESYEYTAITELDDSSQYEWMRNGEIIPEATSNKIILQDISTNDEGEYSVKITSSSGIEKNVSAFKLNVISDSSEYLAGDANCDGKVTIADSTAILQHLGNQDKYGLSEQGIKNGDVDGINGITTSDSLTLQKVDAGLLDVSQLPLTAVEQ